MYSKGFFYIIQGINHVWIIQGTDTLQWTDLGPSGVQGPKGDTGTGIDTLKYLHLTKGNIKASYYPQDGIMLTSTGRATYKGENYHDEDHDFDATLKLPIFGKDGITIDKAADSEKIEISGSELLQKPFSYEEGSYTTDIWTLVQGGTSKKIFRMPIDYREDRPGRLVAVSPEGNVRTSDPKVDYDCANKKYVDDNYVKIPSPAPNSWAVLVYEPGQKKYTTYPMEINVSRLTVPYRDYDKQNFKVGDLTANDDGQYCANKKYVDEAVARANPQFKTLFGSQSIVGTGNIDLYRHHVKISTNSGTYSYEYYTDIISSQNFPIESITDLKTYLGDKFTKDIYGEGTEDTDTTIGLYITQAAIKYLQAGSIHAHSISTATITDTVTTI